MTKSSNIPLSITWDQLSPFAKRYIRKMYQMLRKRGFSINDARYTVNAEIDVVRHSHMNY